LKICIIDTIGLTYDGDTLSKRGLGGSESAVILMSKELQKIGMEVTVYNNCEDSEAKPGIYAGVKFAPLSEVSNDETIYDVVVSSRTIIPFVPPRLYSMFTPDQYGRFHNPESFRNIVSKAKHKVLWLHDTFIMGDHVVEELVTDGHIDEIFTLSDFHTAYITNCDHGKKRIFEVLKNKMFQTRNGIVNYFPYVDTKKKDQNLFVYNASISKGMLPLVHKVWPKVKERIPTAKLVVIGGYYRFRESATPDEQEVMFHKLSSEMENSNLDIEFTGIILQKQIAEILTKASYFIFPGAFPETFGISTLEAINYNVPLIGTRFGALEETGLEQASYLLDYAIEPTPLSPWINSDNQVLEFVAMVRDAYSNPYLHQQKMNYCNIVKDISTWDTVALQWKQHFYKKLKKYLPLDEFRKVSLINSKVKKVFGRRFTNPSENMNIKTSERHIDVIVPFFNAYDYIEECITSIATQNYDNYTVYLIDDASNDGKTPQKVHEVLNKLPQQIYDKFRFIENSVNMGAVFNQIRTIKENCGNDSIVMLIDGDDKLVNDNTIFDFYNNLYTYEQVDYTYGSCWSAADNIPLIAQEYPPEVIGNRSYRTHKFNWGMPYPHLRTFLGKLVKDIPDEKFVDENGLWYKAGGDNATFYNIIEQASKIKAVQDIHYVYNDLNPLNDYKVNGEEQNKTASKIQDNKKVNMKKILIAIPTAKNIEVETFKAIYDLEVPEGYEVDFQYFYGYRIDQVRNLIAKWVKDGNYDYLFSVDSDISFPKDTLKKLLSHDKPMVTGVYCQRLPDRKLEIYRYNSFGNMYNVQLSDLPTDKIEEIDGCGFGCLLIKREVFESINYPHFEYLMNTDMTIKLSEDVDFCMKAKSVGKSIWVDASINCDHHGSFIYKAVQ